MLYVPKTTPYDWQAECLPRTWDTEAHALWCDPRTGKSKLVIDTAGALFEDNRIDGALIVAPAGVHVNWLRTEFPAHMPERLVAKTNTMYWSNDRSKTKGHAKTFERLMSSSGLAVLSMSYDNLMTGRGRDAAKRFLTKRRCLYTLDEAHRIKTPGAKRTMRVVASGKYAPYRRLLTGTPISKGPFDVYAPVRWMYPDFWKPKGLDSFFAFKTYFGKFKQGYNHTQKRTYEELVGYQRLDELREMLEPIRTRVTKEEVGIKGNRYSKLRFELTQKQRTDYEKLRDDLVIELDTELDKHDGVIDVPFAMVRLLRLQQITCGYMPIVDPTRDLDGWRRYEENPRHDVLMEFVRDYGRQGIIWARFRPDIDLICEELRNENIPFVRYDGDVKSEEDRTRARESFQAGDVQWFVGNPAVGGEGVPLWKAHITMYYSNSFKLLERLQSEDRPLHKDKVDLTDVIDIIGADTVDDNIVENLRNKVDIASQVTGDKLREWL
jgi:hypothetical protein